LRTEKNAYPVHTTRTGTMTAMAYLIIAVSFWEKKDGAMQGGAYGVGFQVAHLTPLIGRGRRCGWFPDPDSVFQAGKASGIPC
jgi:hypothetical protein